jgi:hypothetical protein
MNISIRQKKGGSIEPKYGRSIPLHKLIYFLAFQEDIVNTEITRSKHWVSIQREEIYTIIE